jgi:hypothetical protein
MVVPVQVGLLAWFNTQDESGQTPYSLALLGGNVRSVQLVRAKVALLESVGGSVAINIPGESFPPSQDGRSSEALRSSWGNCRSASGEKLNAGKARSSCRVSARCPGRQRGVLYSYIPKSFFLSLVLIATVCVCVSLVFKGPPPVKFVSSPFHWDGLGSGTQ